MKSGFSALVTAETNAIDSAIATVDNEIAVIDNEVSDSALVTAEPMQLICNRTVDRLVTTETDD